MEKREIVRKVLGGLKFKVGVKRANFNDGPYGEAWGNLSKRSGRSGSRK
jgi:hypothetical protein